MTSTLRCYTERAHLLEGDVARDLVVLAAYDIQTTYNSMLH